MFDYQQKVLDSKKKTIICNWTRGLGRTYTLAQIILKNRPKRVVYISENGIISGIKTIQDKIQEIIRLEEISNQFSEVIYNKERTKLKYYCSEDNIEIYSLRDANIFPQYNTQEYDYVLFDGMLPFNTGLKAKQIVSMININNYDRKLQKLYNNHNVEIFEEDFKTGLQYGLFPQHYITKAKNEDIDSFYNNYAIMNNPNDEKGITNIILKAKLDDDELQEQIQYINKQIKGLQNQLNNLDVNIFI